MDLYILNESETVCVKYNHIKREENEIPWEGNEKVENSCRGKPVRKFYKEIKK